MFSEPQYTNSEILIYTYFLDQESVFEQETKPSCPTCEYIENGVYYCATTTENGVYWYVYCLNNPLLYTDPDGQNPIIAAAFIAAQINIQIQYYAGNINSLVDFVAYGAMGFSSAMVGGTVGNAVHSVVGSKIIVNTASCAASSFTNATGNSLISGSSLNEAIETGYKSAIWGGISGAISGSFSEIIFRLKYLKPFLDYCDLNDISVTDHIKITDKKLMRLAKKWYPDAEWDKIIAFSINNSPPEGYEFKDIIVDGRLIPKIAIKARTIPETSGKFGASLTGRSSIYFNKPGISSLKKLYIVTGHELLHVSQISFMAEAGLGTHFLNRKLLGEVMEAAAHSYRGSYYSPNNKYVKLGLKAYPEYSNMMYAHSYPWTNNVFPPE